MKSNSNLNSGKLAEDFVGFLCSRSFFADFTFRGPRYTKARGLEKEAADLMVIFGKTLLAIQIKSKELKSEGGTVSALTLSRIGAKLEKAAAQFRALAEAINTPTFTSLTNGRGVKVEFKKEQVEEVVLLVVVVPIWRNMTERINLRVQGTCSGEGRIPIHFFSLEQFEMLITLADTLPDFLRYLDLSWFLHSEKLLPPDADPIDLWAFSTFNRKKLLKQLERRTPLNVKGALTEHVASTRELEERERQSYMIDRLIDRLSESAGAKVSMATRLLENTTMIAEPNSIKAGQTVIPYLARLDRAERVHLAGCILKRLHSSETEEKSFGGLKFPDHPEGYFVFAYSGHAQERQIGMLNSARAFGFRLNLKKVISIGLDSRVGEPTEAMLIELSNSAITDRVKEASVSLFGPAEEVNFY